MKALLLSLAVMTSSFLAQAATETTNVKTFPVTQAQLAKAHFDQEFKTGSLTIDHEKNTVTLILNREFHCEPGMMCAMVMPAPKIVELPIASIEQGNCGATLIRAQTDGRTRAGIFEQLNVIDNTSMYCRILLPYEGTATYTTSSLGDGGEAVTVTSKLILNGRGLNLSFK